MTAIILTTIVLNDAVDPSDVLVLDRMATYTRRPVKAQRTQRVAGGGFRAIGQEGVQQLWDVTASRCTRADVDWIEAHIGRTVCVRDDAGHKFFGWYAEPDIEEVPRPRTASVQLVLTEVTHSEAVG